jgi:chitin disaccharide deacetylase
MSTVLVNADDFGLHADIDRGILECIERGVVQSLSFSPQGASLDWNKLHELTRAGVRVGLHVTLVGEPWGSDGRVVPHWKALVKQLTFGSRAMRQAVEREIEWQHRQCIEHGVALSHIDSHQHIHAFGWVWQPVLRVARENKIPRVRVPWCPTWKIIKKNAGGIALQALSARLGRRVRESIGSFLPILGIANAGHNTVEIYQREFSSLHNADDVELCVHPGVNTTAIEQRYADWKFDWTGERDALIDPRFRETVMRCGYELARIIPRADSPAASGANARREFLPRSRAS